MDTRLPIIYQAKITRYAGELIPPHGSGASNKCRGLEQEYYTCISNYGFDVGKDKCAAEKMNYQECRVQIKAKKRRIAMDSERHKQGKEVLPDGPAHLHATPFY
ncbi:hypothetical protein KP79_PYT08065 [Mizuhopecten yessoensis]|uniref:Uncharacterized protein n=1 Tax=Mizuhopecten yessoensis TaxID=6573 RepID=A0A210Q9H1_MIZYE|nr:hypothetical protein KP79_PYT08065 [Mizuhopecten yessoensis]